MKQIHDTPKGRLMSGLYATGRECVIECKKFAT